MVLEKDLRVLHLDLQVAGSELCTGCSLTETSKPTPHSDTLPPRPHLLIVSLPKYQAFTHKSVVAIPIQTTTTLVRLQLVNRGKRIMS
ncbi:hypothetical protein I79_006237 [Cricetulus griseus]|uniref:Uncharacterized protein n=1 Tax=Cricetulus griseus TaxID=10029 RepID=G3H7A7_CRIGR|nr:hypothetical protein I79_006237 [Cricetulus griseus]